MTSMIKHKWRVFCLLMYKNFLVRKRHWKAAIFGQILVPILHFLIIQVVRDLTSQPPEQINYDTFYELEQMKDLISYGNRPYIYYVPNDPFHTQLMTSVKQCLDYRDTDIIGFQTEKDAISNYTTKENSEIFIRIAMVVFKSNSTSKKLEYILRTLHEIPRELITTPGETSKAAIFKRRSNFVQLQHCVNMAFIKNSAGEKLPNTNVSIQQMPSPPHVIMDPNDVILRKIFCSIAAMAFLITFYYEANYAACEKFIGVNILLAVNGVKTTTHLFSWLLSGLLFSILYISPIVIMLKFSFSSKVYPYLHYSDGFLFWLVLFIHIAHLLAFGMHIASYFNKSMYVGAGISITYLCSTAIMKYLENSSFVKYTPLLGIVFPNILLYRAIEEMNSYELKLIGIHWNNLYVVDNQLYNVTGSIGMILLFSVLGAIIHFFITVYVYAVKPGKYGVKKHPLYFMMNCYKQSKVNMESNVEQINYNNMEGQPFEPIPDTCTPGIQIRNLKKSYFKNFFDKSSSVEALKGISIDLYKSHITALLGHNGAGKTTIMSILTGMISPSNGEVFINGKNIKKELDKVLNDIGLCPQENMLFPSLSVFQQLFFFGILKCDKKTWTEIKHNVVNLLTKLELLDKRNSLPNELSGGQKRRVCLGMALIGDASILILDEPTSGMDPESRRNAWDIILGMREQKTILISTHNMEEADILGDKVAIIHTGKLRCYGTPMFFKKFYGEGNMEVTLSIESNCDPEKVRNALSEQAQLVSINNGRMVLNVPYTKELPDALDGLETQKRDLGITGMSVSLITLEQVFLKVTKDAEDTVDKNVDIRLDTSSNVTGLKLFAQRMYALLMKKFIYVRTNWGLLALTVLFPLVGVIIMMTSSFAPSMEDSVTLDMSLYQNPQAYYSSRNTLYDDKYTVTVQNQGGVAHKAPPNENLNEVLLQLAKKDNTHYLNNVIAAAEFNETNTNLTINALYSNDATYSLPISLNILYNAILKSFAGDEYGILMSTKALPRAQLASYEQMTETFIKLFLYITFIYIMVSFFVIHPLKENSTGMKHLQLMTGTSPFLYWFTMFLFDFFVFSITSIIIIACMVIFDSAKEHSIYQSTEILIILLLLMLFAVNILPLSYAISFWKTKVSTLTNILSVIPIFLAIAEFVLTNTLHAISNKALVKGIRNFQKAIFYMIPHMSFFDGNFAFFFIAAKNARCRNLPDNLIVNACKIGDECCESNCSSGMCRKYFPYFNKFENDPSLEECVTFLTCTSVFYFALLFVLEKKLIQKMILKIRKYNTTAVYNNIDEQVKAEKEEVALELRKLQNNQVQFLIQNNKEDDENFLSIGEEESNNLFLVYELSKRYRNLIAVRDVSFKIKQRDCFGLLGINGAGKSTTFRMLTGEELPNNGCLYLKGMDIKSQRSKYLSQMGYCPQHSAILETMNTKDHLKLFALLRGISKNKVDAEVDKWIDNLNLRVCASKPSGTYSGGNKRRLSIAIAMIGNPSLVLLDEPTTGVDPAARKSLWEVIASCQASGQSIILTSHSMEECEALCNRLAIMVRGELVCIGPSQQLKQKFGAGYDIQIKLKPNRTDEAIFSLKNEIASKLPCEITDENNNLITYHVTSDRLTWRVMYATMDDLKEKYSCIEDYSVISATLEQLFLQLAKGAKVTDVSTGFNYAILA